MRPTVWARIDLAALRHNAAVVRRLAPRSRILAMLKADAYGHGLVPVARALADQVQGIGVARIDEAVALRAAGWQQTILILAAWLEPEELEWCAAQQVAVVVHDEGLLARLADCRLSRPLRVWLKVNSGMNRLGVPAAACAPVMARIRADRQLILDTVMTHLACADQAAEPGVADQLAAFEAALPTDAPPRSIANSAGLIAHPESRSDWVRPGIMLFGPDPRPGTSALGLRPVMHLQARVLSVREIAPGERVGYGGDWQADRPARIATAGIGYGDGYPRHVAPGTEVSLGGQRLPLAGRVSMDLIGIDVSTRPQTAPGEVVTLWGDDPPVDDIAARAGTISYELLSQVQSRVTRLYPELH